MLGTPKLADAMRLLPAPPNWINMPLSGCHNAAAHLLCSPAPPPPVSVLFPVSVLLCHWRPLSREHCQSFSQPCSGWAQGLSESLWRALCAATPVIANREIPQTFSVYLLLLRSAPHHLLRYPLQQPTQPLLLSTNPPASHLLSLSLKLGSDVHRFTPVPVSVPHLPPRQAVAALCLWEWPTRLPCPWRHEVSVHRAQMESLPLFTSYLYILSY